MMRLLLIQQKLQAASYRYFRHSLGLILFVISLFFLLCRSSKYGTAILLRSVRLSYNSRAIKILKKIIINEPEMIFSLVTTGVDEDEAISRSIILSLPIRQDGVILKGVILIKFTRTFSYFLNKNWFDRLNELFVFVLEPSWAGYADPDILSFLVKAEHCFVEASEVEDRSLLNGLFPDGRSLSFGSGDWVDPDIFSPTKSLKRYDSIYVANLNPMKRVSRYIDAVSEIVAKTDPGYKACIVCASWGDGAQQLELIKSHIKNEGLESNLELIIGLSREDLVKKLGECKSSILLSYKEGSNRAIFESMFVDVPVVCISENIGVNKSYVNEHTGVLVSDLFLEDALVEMKSNWRSYRPREWALDNISPQITTLKLSKVLETKIGPLCNSSLYVKVNSPELDYYDLNGRSAESIVRPIFQALTSRDDVAIWGAIEICYESLKGKSVELEH